MNGHGEKLSRKQEQAIAALLSEPTVEKAAEKAGVCHATLKKWLHLTEFKAAFQAARRAVLESTVVRLLCLTGNAITTLHDNLTADQGAVRNTAALGILDRALKGIDTLDLMQRVEELERRIRAKKK